MNIRYAIIIFVLIFGLFTPVQAQDQQLELVKISFNGNLNYSDATLRGLIKSQETPMWLWKFLNSFSSLGKSAAYFDASFVETDIRLMKEFFTANGSFVINISHEVKKDTVKKTAELIYYLTNTAKARIGNFALIGLDSLEIPLKSEINGLFTMDSSKFYSQQEIKSAIDQTVVLLENNGYPHAKFDSTIVIKDTIKTRADVSVYMQSGKSYTISRVEIDKKGEGAAKVDEQMLRDIIGIKDAERYNLERIRQSQVRLFRTGLFSSIILAPKLTDTVGNTVPLLLTGTIGTMNEVAPEILMNNQNNAFNVGFGGNYYRKNFFGGARKLSVTGNFGVSNLFESNFSNLIKTFSVYDTSVFGYIEGSMRIEQPYVFNRPILGILDGYYKLNKDIASNKRSFGGKISFEFELPTYTFINYLNAYYNFEVINEVFLQKGTSFSLNESLSILGAEMKSYKANDPISPTHGYNLTFLFEEANLESYSLAKLFGIPFNSTLFYKFAASAAFYAPIMGNHNHVIAWKLKTGHLQAYKGPEKNIPSTRKFTAGGSNSLRGWKARELAPIEEITILGEQVEVTGGTVLLEAALEYRYHFTKEIGAVVFNDFGNTWLGYDKMNGKDIAYNIGFGLRYFTPFAPVRVDFGFKMYDPNNTKSISKKSFLLEVFEFQFGIGEAF